jgi:hypothetical protein
MVAGHCRGGALPASTVKWYKSLSLSPSPRFTRRRRDGEASISIDVLHPRLADELILDVAHPAM